MNSPSIKKKAIKTKAIKKGTCSRILTPKQVGPICWFMATFVAMFYSQRSRKLLLEASNNWDKEKELFTLLKHVLDDKYLKTADGRESEDYKNFSDDTFLNMLSLLNKENKNEFPFNPKHKNILGSFRPKLYIGKLYTLLGVDYKMFDYSTTEYILRYSYLNKDYDYFRTYKIEDNNIIDSIEDKEDRLKGYRYIEDNYAPPILLLRVYNYHIPIYDSILTNNIIPDDFLYSNIRYRKDNITYNKKNYTLDSVVLSNSNTDHNIGHIIAGITCKKERYVYNGWPRINMDPAQATTQITQHIPCELMKYKWNQTYDANICLNRIKCMPDILKTKVANKDFCFNFSSGVRILIYVRNDSKSATSSSNSVNKLSTAGISPTQSRRSGRSSKNTPQAAQGTPQAAQGTPQVIKKSPQSPTADISPTQPKRRGRASKKTPPAAQGTPPAAQGTPQVIKNSPQSPTADVAPTQPKRRGRPSKKTPPAAQGTPPVAQGTPPAAQGTPRVIKKSPTQSPTADVAPTQPRRSERLRKKAADANK